MPENHDAIIVAAQPEAAEAGARVLMQGGNAVDAAMAAALVQGVVDPQMCGIAGFGSCHIYMPEAGVETSNDQRRRGEYFPGYFDQRSHGGYEPQWFWSMPFQL